LARELRKLRIFPPNSAVPDCFRDFAAVSWRVFTLLNQLSWQTE